MSDLTKFDLEKMEWPPRNPSNMDEQELRCLVKVLIKDCLYWREKDKIESYNNCVRLGDSLQIVTCPERDTRPHLYEFDDVYRLYRRNKKCVELWASPRRTYQGVIAPPEWKSAGEEKGER